MLVRRYAKRTITSYVTWVRRYLRYHHLRHPREMGQDEINAFLTHLAVNEKLSASSQNQALGALLFLFSNLQGTPALVAQILYGSGLRLIESPCYRRTSRRRCSHTSVHR
jgi:hypothetical protein